jgi:hypothetical protein
VRVDALARLKRIAHPPRLLNVIPRRRHPEHSEGSAFDVSTRTTRQNAET